MLFHQKSAILIAVMVSWVGVAVADEYDDRCEQGGYVDSAEMCELLAKIAVDYGKPPEEQLKYRLLAARRHLWQCTNPSSEACQKALETLWMFSDDPSEVTMAVGLFQEGCAQSGDAAACRHATQASWYGHGVPIDATASLAWFRQCKGCDAFAPDVLTLSTTEVPWDLVDRDVHVTRMRALVAAGGAVEAEQALRHAIATKAVSIYDAPALTDELATLLWRVEVEPYRAAGDPFVTLAAAQRLDRRFDSPRVSAMTLQLYAEVSARQLELMRQATAARLPLASRLHAIWARALYAQLDVPAPIDPFADQPWKVKLVGLDASCDWLTPWIDRQYPAEKARSTLRAPLVCTQSTEERTVTTSTTKDEDVAEERTRTVKGGCRSTVVLCVGGYKTSDWCQKTECTPDHEETYFEHVTKPVTRTKSERHTYSKVTIKGSLEGPFGTATVDVQREGFGNAITLAMAAVDAEVERMTKPARDAQLAKELAGANRATGLAREEYLLRAMALGASSKALADVVGLEQSQLDELLANVTFTLPALPASRTSAVALATPTPIDSGFSAAAYPEPTRPAMVLRTFSSSSSGAPEDDRDAPWRRLARGTLFGAGAIRRAGGLEETTGFGVRLEHGLRIARSFKLTHAVMLAGGFDGERGPSFDARVGVASGVRASAIQALYMAGVGVGGLAERDEMTGDDVIDTAPDFFHGADLVIGKERGLAFHGRFLFVAGGPIDKGTRITVELLYRRASSSELGLALTRHHIENGENLLGVGLVYRAAR